MRTNELILYKNMEYGDILQDMTFLMENFHNDYYNREDLRSLLFRVHECLAGAFCEPWVRGQSVAYIPGISSGQR